MASAEVKGPLTPFRLPRVPSQLLRLALEDLHKAEQSPDYVVDMRVWYTPTGKNTCAVCLGGVVIAFSLGGIKTKEIIPSETTEKSALDALNAFRSGRVREGCERMGADWCRLPETDSYAAAAPYAKDRDEFYRDMHQIAENLERIEL